MSFLNRVYSPYKSISEISDGYLGDFLSIKAIPLRILISLLPFIIVFVPLSIKGVTVSATLIAVLLLLWIAVTLILWFVLRYVVIKGKEVTESVLGWSVLDDLEWLFAIVRFPAVTWLMLFALLFRRDAFVDCEDGLFSEESLFDEDEDILEISL